MSFRATVCNACHKEIQVPADLVAPSCPYCGNVVEGAAPSATVSTLIGLARTALTAGNSDEAIEYFNRALESDPTNSQAWLGKGKAAGWKSTMANIRLPEMLIAFNHAIANAADNEKSATIDEAVTEVNRLVAALYGMSHKHMIEYVSLKNSWSDHVAQVGQMLNALTEISEWKPDEAVTFGNIVHLSKSIIEGVSYRDTFDQNSAKSWGVTESYEQTLRGIMGGAVQRLRSLDPSYTAPTIEKKEAEGCFVITATMGDADHPTVAIMRRFRDEWLVPKPWGRRFIEWYYRKGPAAAAFISRSPLRRQLSYAFIVRPAEWLARQLLR